MKTYLIKWYSQIKQKLFKSDERKLVIVYNHLVMKDIRWFVFVLAFCLPSIVIGQNIFIGQGGTVLVNGGELFYDGTIAGGTSGVDGNTNYTITLAPAVAGKRVCLDFTSFNTYYSTFDEKGDSVCIFDGSNTSANKIATLRGNYGADWGSGSNVGWNASGNMPTVTSPGIFCATNANGSLTITFNNFSSTTSPGWVATVSTYTPLGTPGCNVNLTATPNPICSGAAVTLTATGDIVTAAINNNFNGSTVGSGWQGTSSATFQTNICSSPSLDNSVYLWMANAACPRTLTSNGMDVSNGGTVSFDYRQASINSASSPCESPDVNMSSATPEAVLLQYSTNGGTTWTTMKVMFPYNMNNVNASADYYPGTGYEVTKWNKIIVPITAAASTANTMFRWYMPLCSSASTDNWGLDNVVIGSPKTATITIKDLTNNVQVGTSSTTSPYSVIVNPTATTLYEATITDGISSCTSQVTVTVNPGTPLTVTCGTPTTSSVTFNWNALAGATSYSYSYSVNGGTAITGSTTATTLTIGSLAPGSSVQITVTPVGASCASPSSCTCVAGSCATPTANAGTDKVLTCTTTSVVLDGSASSSGANYSYLWSTTGGNIVSGGTTNSPTVNAAGTYTLTVTNSTGNCIATDSVTVTSNTTAPTVTISTPSVLTCTTTSTTLTATGGGNYSWAASSGGNILSGAATATITVTTAGTYTVTVTDATNGCKSTMNKVVTSNLTPPSVTISNPAVLNCTQTSTTLTATGGGTYVWAASLGGNILSGSATATVTVNSAGTYTVTVTDATNGCTTVMNKAVSSNTTAPIVTITDPEILTCATASTSMTATGGGNYLWSASLGGNIVSGGNTATITVNAAGTYAVTVTNPTNGCTTVMSKVVTSNIPSPLVTITDPAILTCTTTSTTLTASGGGTYAWASSGGGNILSGAATATITVNSTGTYVVTVTNVLSGCTATMSKVVTSNTTPPTVTISTPSVLTCTTTSASLTATGGDSYIWGASAGGNIVSGAATASINVSSVGTYTVTVTDATNGCTTSMSKAVTSNTTLPTANADSDQVLTCATTSVVLNGSASSSGTDIIYSWSTSTGNIVSGGSTNSATVDAAGTYTLLVSNTTNGCSITDNVIVTSNTVAPIANAGSDQIISCSITSVSLDASVSSNGSQYSYNWSTSDGHIFSGINTLIPVVDQAGTYTLSVSNTVNGCNSSDNVVVGSNIAFPVSNAGSDQVLTCTNTSALLDGSASSSGVNYVYSWTTLDGNIVSGVNSNSATVDLASTYVLQVTNTTNGCFTIDNVVVTSNITPPLANAGNDVSFCSGSNASLGSSSVANNTYLWSPSTGLSSASIASPIVTLTNTGSSATVNTYQLTVTNSINGCTAVDQVNVTVMPEVQIAVVINVLPSNIICSGDMVIFTATATNGGLNPTYQWKVNGVNVGANTNTFSSNNLSNNDQITCQLTSSEICAVNNPSVSNIIVMQVGSIMPVSVNITSNPTGVICPGSSVTFMANATNGGTNPIYQWKVNGLNVGANSSVYTNAALYNGDIISCTLISSETCVTNNPASTQITISTLPSLSIDLVASPLDICPGDPVSLNATVLGGAGTSYTLTLNGQIVSLPLVEYPDFSQYYFITATDNCSSATDSVYINVSQVPQVFLTSDVISGCAPLTVAFNSVGSETCTFTQWNFSDPNNNVSFQQKPTHVFEDAGTYAISLTVQTTTGCKYTYNMGSNVTVYPLPVANFIMDKQVVSIVEPVINFENYSTNASSSYWSFGDGDSSSAVNPTHYYSNTGYFTIQLVVETDKGCKDTTKSEVKINEIVTFYAPTAFTPDFDNINDLFVIKGVGIDTDNFKMMIYNRWGEPIFTSESMEIGWNGKISNSDFAKTDTYVWVVVYKDINGRQHEKTGNVTLIR